MENRKSGAAKRKQPANETSRLVEIIIAKRKLFIYKKKL